MTEIVFVLYLFVGMQQYEYPGFFNHAENCREMAYLQSTGIDREYTGFACIPQAITREA